MPVTSEAFIVSLPLLKSKCNRSTCLRTPNPTQRWVVRRSQRENFKMGMPIEKPSLYAGMAILAGVLTNRIVFTSLDSLAMTQSRSDILGVITGATLVLYGVGKAEIAESKSAVEMDGVDVRLGVTDEEKLGYETEWAANAIFKGSPNICSFTLVSNGVGRCFFGRFRDYEVGASLQVPDGGTIANAMSSGQRAYLADMKVVPVKETEFGFLPKNCQAVVVQPVSESSAIVLGANKPRPLTGSDFGWIQAIANRLASVLEVGG